MSTRELDRVGASMYFAEGTTMIGLLLAEIERIEEASADWVNQHGIAEAQARVESHDDFSHETFGNALNAQVNRQFDVYVAFGALLGYWARLSLLFHPTSRDAWAKRRGELLREVFGLADNTLLANRSFRDAWVHFDERLDFAFRHGRLGNRLIFGTNARASLATKNAVLVIDVEALVLHYPLRDGRVESVRVADMKHLLARLHAEVPNVGARIMLRFPAPQR